VYAATGPAVVGAWAGAVKITVLPGLATAAEEELVEVQVLDQVEDAGDRTLAGQVGGVARPTGRPRPGHWP
jgi:hypothetical protein